MILVHNLLNYLEFIENLKFQKNIMYIVPIHDDDHDRHDDDDDDDMYDDNDVTTVY